MELRDCGSGGADLRDFDRFAFLPRYSKSIFFYAREHSGNFGWFFNRTIGPRSLNRFFPSYRSQCRAKVAVRVKTVENRIQERQGRLH